MKYTLSENKKIIKNLLIEAPTTDPPNGQQIPITMNQIMQFQKYIWSTIEKDIPKVANTCRSKDKKTDCAYNSMLCPVNKKPCWKKDAVDGFWGPTTITAWDKYKKKYTSAFPNWWVDDPKTGQELSGQEIPVTITQTKNFQKWYLEQIEKVKPNASGLYTTKLCSAPCKYSQAVDGVFGNPGSNTRKLWDTYKTKYMEVNPNWYREIDFDQNVVRSQERINKIISTFIFTNQNPSGWNKKSAIPDIPKWIVQNANTLFKFDPESATKLPNNYGWDTNTNLFPFPKEYTQADFDLFMPEGGLERIKKAEQERADYYIYLNNNKSDRLGAGGSFERQQSAMTGIPTRGQKLEEYWQSEIKAGKGPQYVAGEQWNANLKRVKSVIAEKCKAPLTVTGIGDSEGENAVYISYSDICKYAGGLWVWNAGEGPNAFCGCRVMERTNGLNGEQLFTIKGPNGQNLTVQIDFEGSMAYQTPGGKRDIEEYQVVHDVLTVVELGLLAISFAAGPAAPLFIGLSAVAGVIDSSVYFYQGDKYMGVMLLGISMLGASELIGLVKYGKATIKSLGKEGIEAIAKKQLAKQALTEAEQLAVKEIQTAVYTSQNAINTSLKVKMVTEFTQTGIYASAVKSGWGWDQFFSIYYKINKKLLGLPSITGMLLKIGGVAYSIDQVYLAIYGNDEDRKYSAFSQLFDYFKNASEEEKKVEVLKAFEQYQKEIAKNPSKFLNPEMIEAVLNLSPQDLVPMDEREAYFRAKNGIRADNMKQERDKVQKEHKFTNAPSLSEVESGKSTLSWGVSGNSVTELQNLLISKGYELTPNGIFDWETDFAIVSYQSKNGINPTGIVDLQTLKSIKEKEIPVSCGEKINSLKSSGWLEITKIEYMKKLDSQENIKKTERVDCNGDIKYFFMANSTSQPNTQEQPRSVGQAPILKTIVDNPDLQEIYKQFKRLI
jgi:hypothetical protein